MFKDDDGRVIKRPMVATRLSRNWSIGGYRRHMTTINDTGNWRHWRLIIVDPASDKYVAKTAPVG